MKRMIMVRPRFGGGWAVDCYDGRGRWCSTALGPFTKKEAYACRRRWVARIKRKGGKS